MYFMFNSGLKNGIINGFNYLHISRNLYETHYEILKLPQNCTNKEIKESFIKLSKEYHPDSKNANSSENKFVKLVEAYNVLSKPTVRRSYDLGLSSSSTSTSTHQNYYDFQHEDAIRRNPWDDPSFYKNRDKSQDKYYSDKPYYGFKGISKVSNGTIVIMCFLVAFTAVVLQLAAVRHSVTLKRDEMIRKSNENELILSQIQNEASENGNLIQIEKFKEKMRQNKYANFTDE